MNEQPAIKNYFFGKAYNDLKNTVKDSWKNNKNSADGLFQKSRNAEMFPKYLYFSSGLAVLVFGTLCFSIISLIHSVFLFLLSTLIFLLFSSVFVLDTGYRIRKRIFMACPYCYEKHILPVYHCPKCKVGHDSLWPGKFGILKRTCKCGHKIPTTFFNGRTRLRASCPSCRNTIESVEARPVVFPVIGAPSAGKTYFLFSLVHYIKERYVNQSGHKFSFMNDYNSNLYDSEISSLNAGRVLRKTTENNPIALNFFLSKNRSKSLFFFYDSAGEAFSSTQYLSQHKFYNYFHGLFFIIDPFSIPQVRATYQKELMDNPGIRPSNYSLDDVYEASVINLEKNYGYKITERIRRPVAIVFSKVDAFDLQHIIGNAAADTLMASDPLIKTKQDAMNKLCKEFLISNGMEPLLRKLEWKFPVSGYFSVSSAGRNSIGFDQVVNWMLAKINSSYRIK